MTKTEHAGGLTRKLVAFALGAVAAKLAISAVEQFWTKGLRRGVPEMSDEESMLTKVAWIGLTAAAVGMARELARELAAPRVREDVA